MNKTAALLLEGKQVDLENMEIVNKKIEYSFLSLLIPMCLLIVSLNMEVLRKLWKTENTTVNKLMKLDCTVNIMYALQSTFQQSPFFRGLGEELYCYPHLVLTMAFAVLNRLLPVAIVAFRSVICTHLTFFKKSLSF